MPGLRIHSRPSLLTRWLAGMALSAFLFSLVPIPFHLLQPGPQDSTPYPCQSKRCGCKSAKHCWTQCCCHTPKQRYAWAKARRIVPPTYAILDAGDDAPQNPRDRLIQQLEQQTQSLVHCSRPTSSSLASSSRSSDSTDSQLPPIDPCFDLDTCHGQASSFTSLPWMTLALKAKTLHRNDILVDPTLPWEPSYPFLSDPPDTPPPRPLA